MLQRQLLRRLHKQVLQSLPKSAKPMKYLLTYAISATHRKEKQDAYGARSTTVTKTVAGCVTLSWKMKTAFGVMSTVSTRTNASTATQLGQLMAYNKVLPKNRTLLRSGARSTMLPNWNVVFASLNSPASWHQAKVLKSALLRLNPLPKLELLPHIPPKALRSHQYRLFSK